jgi:hypothetical protein
MLREDTQDAHFMPEKIKTPAESLSSASRRAMRELQRAQEVDNVLLLARLQVIESVDDLGSLRANLPSGAITCMQLNGSHNVIGAAVMQEEDPLTRAPQRRGAEFIALRLTLADAVRQSRAHVMQRKV